ncbi:ABC transporter substrate-binding protein [Paenibacillus sp. GCM10027626]|uniref:ABC transporter substrate-binding protein n=1 Tax=Paenibacillus sp. GCM10027626 TaxID=3273411 RepID=UPI003624BC42
MKKYNGVLLASMLLVASLGFTGCAATNKSADSNSQNARQHEEGQSSTRGENKAGDEKATIRLATAMDPARLEPFKKLVDEWNAANPNVEVKLENTAYEEYWKKLQVMTASNTMPDVWVYTPGLGSQWLENGQLLPLNQYMEGDETLNKADFHPMMIDYMTYEGDVYGLPYDVSAQVLFYNKDLFDQAKIDYPTNNWTFDDLRQAAEKITALQSDKGKIYGMLSMMGADFTGDTYFRSFGATTITPEGKVGVNNEGGAEALQYFLDNVKLGVTPKPEPGKSTRPLWLNGLGGMLADGGWAIPSFKDVPFEWGMARLPAGPAGQFTTGLGGAFVISKQTKYPKQSYEFLKYLTSTEGLNEIVTKVDAGVPGRMSSQEGLSPLMKQYADIISTATPYNAINGLLELQDVMGKEMDQVWYSAKDPKAVVQAIEEKGNKVLESKRK